MTPDAPEPLASRPDREETVELSNEEATAAFAARLAAELRAPATVYLRGDLGVGKTTFTRYFLRAHGVTGSVKSPTYTLLEPYQLGEIAFYHFDLYRINDPWELELAGFAELFDEPALRFVEWPERGADWLPEPRLDIQFSASSGTPDTSAIATAEKANSRRVHLRWYDDN